VREEDALGLSMAEEPSHRVLTLEHHCRRDPGGGGKMDLRGGRFTVLAAASHTRVTVVRASGCEHGTTSSYRSHLKGVHE
jgi:hypothetical protein